MNQVEVKFEKWLSGGFELYKANMGVMILAMLITGLLASITAGVLAGPLAAGVATIALALIDKKEPKPVVGDVFKGFQFFLPAFLYVLTVAAVMFITLIFSFIPLLGQLLQVAIGLGVTTATLFTLFLIVDRKLAFWPAIMESLNMVKGNPGMFLVYALVVNVLAGLGIIACGIGVVVTMPFYACAVAVAYRDLYPAEGSAVPAAPTA